MNAQSPLNSFLDLRPSPAPHNAINSGCPHLSLQIMKNSLRFSCLPLPLIEDSEPSSLWILSYNHSDFSLFHSNSFLSSFGNQVFKGRIIDLRPTGYIVYDIWRWRRAWCPRPRGTAESKKVGRGFSSEDMKRKGEVRLESDSLAPWPTNHLILSTPTSQMSFLSLFFKKKLLFTRVQQDLVAAHGIFNLRCGMRDLKQWHVGSSSLMRGQTQAPCVRTVNSATRPPGKSSVPPSKLDASGRSSEFRSCLSTACSPCGPCLVHSDPHHLFASPFIQPPCLWLFPSNSSSTPSVQQFP